MPNINISIKNKIAVQTDRTRYVCGNSDFTAVFDFDAEWDAFETKTARFRFNGQHTEVIFTGNECNIPIITDTNDFEIGVFAGDLHTSTPALVLCDKSILCGSGFPADPPADVYAQLVAQLSSKISEPSQDGTAGQALITDGNGGRSWATVQGGGASNAVLYTEQELSGDQQAQARANIDADIAPLKITRTRTGMYSYSLDHTFADVNEAVDQCRRVYIEDSSSRYELLNRDSGLSSAYVFVSSYDSTSEKLDLSYITLNQDNTHDLSRCEILPETEITNRVPKVSRVKGKYLSSSTGPNNVWISPATEISENSVDTDMVSPKAVYDFVSSLNLHNGITPTIGDNGNWYLGDNDTGKPSRGEKGDTGPQGPAGQDGKDGAGMDVTGATVGQIAKITAVDANGVPTAWEPVDMPSGGGEWEYINSITLESDVGTLLLSTDAAGNAIEYDEIALVCVFAGTSANTAEGYVELKLITQNGNVTKDYTKIAYARRKSGTVASVVHIYAASAGDYTVVVEEVLSGTASATNIFTGSAGIKCCGIRLWASDNEYIGAGTTIQLFGRNGSAE